MCFQNWNFMSIHLWLSFVQSKRMIFCFHEITFVIFLKLENYSQLELNSENYN